MRKLLAADDSAVAFGQRREQLELANGQRQALSIQFGHELMRPDLELPDPEGGAPHGCLHGGEGSS